MAIIKCPECGQDISDKAEFCVHCGAKYNNAGNKICPECGANVAKKSPYCDKCGFPFEETVEEEIAEIVLPQIPKKKKPYKAIIISVCIILCLGVIIYAAMVDRSKMVYADNMGTAVEAMTVSATENDNCGRLLIDVWSNSIYKTSDKETDKYTKENGVFYKDFNDALYKLEYDTEYASRINKIIRVKNEVSNLMIQLKDPPKEFEESHQALKTLHTVYVDFINFVTYPNGSLTTFSDDFYNKYDEFQKQLNQFEAVKVH